MNNKDYVLVDKKSTFIDKRAKIGKNVIIYENVRIDGKSVIEDNVTIFPNCFINNSIIGKGSKIYSSIIENSNIGVCCAVGPYCHLRSSLIGEFVYIGDFSVLKQIAIKNNENLIPYTCLLGEKENKKLKKDN